jgi:hypothetical protein
MERKETGQRKGQLSQEEKDRRFTKRVKNFVCFNTHLRIVNQIIYKEYIFGLWNNRKDWEFMASIRLAKEHGIISTPNTLKVNLSKIKNKNRSAIAASDFTSGLSYTSVPLSRYEKDAMHARMEVLEHQFINRPTYYVGLPANQIIAVSRQYDRVVACEKEYLMSKFMFDMNRYVGKENNITIHNKDILDFLKHTRRKFNIFDFDFMWIISPELIKNLALCIKRTSKDRALIAVTSAGGRKITEKRYKELMPKLLISELNKDFSIINKPFSGKYKDHIIPMRYELLVIERK